MSNNIVKKKLKIDGMHCSSCAMNIDFDLEDLEGVKSVKTNYAKQESEVEFDEEKIEFKVILEQIKKTGYTASPK
ncbi:MAG TPA: heavy metal-associated domain-containing protein [Candidatus Levybacteria bacterium]|nr:heavy metal-associated domain-containing protein [Candidatus Levybacteria bacterium]